MKKLKKYNKTILFIIALSTIGIFLAYSFNNNVKPASAWYSDSYRYRQTATVTNNTGTQQTDYQLKISLDTATMISASQLQSDCDDLRFTNISGQELPYWIESGCNSATTKIWVKADRVPVGSSSIYVYYGNATAPSAQNGDATFELFDDFLSPNINNSKWDMVMKGTGGNVSVTSAGEATLSPTPLTISSVNIKSKKQFTNNVAIEARRKLASATNYINFSLGGGNFGNSSGDQTSWWHTDLGEGYFFYSNGVASNEISTVNSTGLVTGNLTGGFGIDGAFTSYQRFQYIYQSNGDIWWFVNDTREGSATTSAYLSNTKNILLSQGEHTSGVGDTQYIDWVFVRKIAGTPGTTEPSVGSFGTAETGEAPVAYWKFDEGSGAFAYDESASANDGTIVGAAWQTEDDCKIGKCLFFNGGSSYISRSAVSVSSTLNFGTDSFSVSFWMKASSTLAGKRIIFKRDSSVRGYEIFMSASGNGKISALFGTNIDYVFSDFTDKSIMDNSWHQIAIIFNRSSDLMYAFVDGVAQAASLALPEGSSNSTANITLGAYDGTSNFYGGFLDEVKIYPYARTASQIKKDYASGRLKNTGTGSGTGVSAGAQVQSYKTEGLVGHWKMDEASWSGVASEVIDSSGAGNHGTATSANTSSTAKYGRSGDFNGSTTAVSVNTANTPITTAVTIAGWYQTNTLTASSGHKMIFSSAYSYTYVSLIYNGMAQPFCSLGIDSQQRTVASGVNSTVGRWTHFACTYDGQTMRVFVDGEEKNRLNVSGNITSFSGSSLIGDYSAAGYEFDGNLDDVRLYNRALSGAEIRRLYNDAPPPVLHLKMDEGTGQYAYDNSGRSATGTLGSAPTSGTDDPTWASASTCKYGGCLSFDGGDYAAVANNASLQMGKAITLSMWIKQSSNNSNNGLIYKGSFASTHGDYQMDVVNGVIQFTLNGYLHGTQTSAILSVGKWQYVTATSNGTTMSIYLDGVLQSSTCFVGTCAPGSITTSSNNLIVGGYFSSSFAFKGLIDDVRIYDYARTVTQIREDMLSGAPVYTSPRYSVAPNAPNSTTNSSGMVAYWKFDEGTTSTYAYDTTSNNNDGIYYGSVSSTPGKFGRAADFYTGSYVNAGDINSIDGANRITVSAWVKWGGSAGGASAEKEIMIKENVFAFSAGFATGKARFWIYDSSWKNSGDSKTNIDDRNWHYYAGVYDGTYVKVYIDGVLENSNNIGSTTLSSNSNPVCIGLRTCDSAPNYNWLGKIDELKIYNVALTADEIKADYNKGKAMMLGGVSSEDSVASSGSGDRPAQSSASGRLVGWWKMDEKSGQYSRDISGSGNDSTLGANTGSSTDDPTWKSSAFCRSGSCLSFDGTADYVNVGNKADLNLTNNFSLAAWVKQNAAGAIQGIISKSDGGFSGSQYELRLNSSGIPQFVATNGTSVFTASHNAILPGRWYHIVGVMNNKVMNVYVNGVEGTSATLTGTQSTTSNATQIGKSYSGGYFFNGYLDDVKAWNYALSQAEIAYEYNRGKPVAQWKFDEGQGNYAYDASGNNNHGYVTIGTGGTQSTTSSAWTAGASGKFNSSMSFDGTDDRIMISGPTGMNFSSNSQSFTVSTWVNPAALDATYDGIISTKLLGDDSWSIYRDSPNQFFSFQYSSTNLINFPAVTTGAWHHYAAVYNGTTIQLYFDGIAYGLPFTRTLTITNNSIVCFGLYRCGYPAVHLFSGRIDDTRVYNYPLSASQIKEVFNNGKAVYFK